MKRYCCIDCGKKIYWKTALYGQGRCNSCEMKRRYNVKIMNFKGKKHPNYKNGNSLKKHYCIDCGKRISKNAKRCRSCALKGRLNGNYGIKFSKKRRKKYEQGKKKCKIY